MASHVAGGAPTMAPLMHPLASAGEKEVSASRQSDCAACRSTSTSSTRASSNTSSNGEKSASRCSTNPPRARRKGRQSSVAESRRAAGRVGTRIPEGDGRPAQSRLASSLREIVRGTRMKLELCDYCGHESKSGTGARYGKRKVPVLARQMALFPRFKVPALNKPRAPHKRVRRTRAQIAADTATRAARRQARERGLGLICPSPLPDISRWQRTFELSSTTGSKVIDSRWPRAPLSPVAACKRLPAAYH